MVYRIFVEKKGIHAVEAKKVFEDLKTNLQINTLSALRIFNRYDVEGIDENIFSQAKRTIFSEPQTDEIYQEIPESGGASLFAIEYIPGQFDQRADSCAQCIQILSQKERPMVRTAKIYMVSGVEEAQLETIKTYLINPVESREASFAPLQTLAEEFVIPTTVETLSGFRALTREGLDKFIKDRGLAMDIDDITFLQNYFINTEKRDPTVTEIKLIDSYWSDHCRHTTFSTKIDEVMIDEFCVERAFRDYIQKRNEVYGERASKKSITLMDIATLGAKYLKKNGTLKNLDESDEINACSVKIKAEIDGEEQDWILMFKNETHNHPTEIEPFGGAATCLGGAIRDPLSGRSYVYQAMRVTGAADPRLPVSQTIPGKLPQSKITQGAANGYSSYGNQIGLATGGVYEVYHSGYAAKRLEIGAVVGAAPADHIKRSEPEAGDVVILLGGRTGRDGCGGATGSSKAHTAESLASCGAEVQKGNPPEERKLQRLFRKKEAAALIKRCNDFGAGGVSVAVGELADGLIIDLSKMKKKYEGLDGTELAISESQERMAVVVKAENAAIFMNYAEKENLEAEIVATVLAEKRLKMQWNGNIIVNISREFLNSNGAEKHTKIVVQKQNKEQLFHTVTDKIKPTFVQSLKEILSDLNVCSQKGLVERFDSTIGAASVILPFGGKHQTSPSQYMAAKLPVDSGICSTASCMAYGFNPYLSEKSPFHGGLFAVVESVTKLVAAGVPFEKCYLTLQEYFERTQNDPERWGKPFSALLGAFTAQVSLGLAAIGGKDSMSGTFEDLDVPPTLVSFAVAAENAKKLITNEFKKHGSKVFVLRPLYDEDTLPDFGDLKKLYGYLNHLIENGTVISARAIGFAGIAEAVYKLCIGNEIGFRFDTTLSVTELFKNNYGAVVVETDSDIQGELLGYTTGNGEICFANERVCLSDLAENYTSPLEKVFPTKVDIKKAARYTEIPLFEYPIRTRNISNEKFAKPRVLIPVFPGTNCEYDSKKQFDLAGGSSEVLVFRNITPSLLSESIESLVSSINQSQILMIPGGFSGGDEPDGSGKFITSVFRNPRVKHAVTKLLEDRDGLILGICNGFQALIKLGLLPYGKILDELTPDCPTLTFNAIGRHQSMMVNTRVSSVHSPWLRNVEVGDIHTVAISHGEGRFYANETILKELATNGQIATQYVDLDGKPTNEMPYNPNCSDMAIEGILSPDGRVFGKMGHSERQGIHVVKNIPGNKDQKIFASGVEYFK